MRKTWRNQLRKIPRLKSKLKTRSGIGELLTDQKDPNSRKTDDDKEKAEILAEFFQSVFTKEPNDTAPTLPLKETNFKMIEMKITEDEIVCLSLYWSCIFCLEHSFVLFYPLFSYPLVNHFFSSYLMTLCSCLVYIFFPVPLIMSPLRTKGDILF
jgi:hypothetical protein